MGNPQVDHYRRAREFAEEFWAKNSTQPLSKCAKALNNARLTTPLRLLQTWHNEYVARKVSAMGGLSPPKQDNHPQANRPVIPSLAPFNPPRVERSFLPPREHKPVVPGPSKILGTERPTDPVLAVVPSAPKAPLLSAPPTFTPPDAPKRVKRAPSRGKNKLILRKFTGTSYIVGDARSGGGEGITLACVLECGHVTIRGQSNLQIGNGSPNHGKPLQTMGCYLCTQQDKESEERRLAAEKAAKEAQARKEAVDAVGAKFADLMAEMKKLGLDPAALVKGS